MDDKTPLRPLCYIVSPVGCLGYGFDEDLTTYHLARVVSSGVPTAIILDSGSTDSGPNKLALGSMTCPQSAYYKDLSKMVKLVHTFQVPLLFSSAGGDGADEHVQLMGQIIEEIASKENQHYRFKTISTFSSIDKGLIKSRWRAGRVSGCGPCVPQLTEDNIESSVRVVAQAGYEPFLDAMEAYPDFDIIIGGRAYDPAPYVAYCVFRLKQEIPGLHDAALEQRLGSFMHMGKIMECGGQCSTPKSHGAIATVFSDGLFHVEPMAPESKCTPLSVAAHTMYENTRPDLLRGPGGVLDLNSCRYEQLADGRTVKVSGSRYRTSTQEGMPYRLKLEAACVKGYRSMFLGSVRDHILINQIDNLLPRVKTYVQHQHADLGGKWDLGFHVYGKGQKGPNGPGELFMVVEALAETQQLATSLASKARVGMIHGPYPGQKATSGNFAFGIGGLMEIETGECAQFSMYHLIDLEPGEERLSLARTNGLFRATCRIIGSGPAIQVNHDFLLGISEMRKQLPLPTSNSPNITQQPSRIYPPRTISDVASVLRSKNAGPYEITIDIIFQSAFDYRWVKESNVLSRKTIAHVLGIQEKDIVWMGFFEPALAFKVTIPRFRGGVMASSGSFMENDVHGSQQHTAVGTIGLPTPRARSVVRRKLYKILPSVASFWGLGILYKRKASNLQG
ncbi:hypothetical protein B0I35DRAFT_493239 [Stachybotrys elegans]|uniref:Caib baif family enzyme n=1 Tax=Stachybotrys elegans TaxID=80388 RepID=A0A8K0SIU5_9HYPO|nr:hypothetical protein B0I35DRAFT_493239 [Stachybotrys elegans]